MIRESKISKQQQEQVRKKEKAFKDADDFIVDLHMKMEPISLSTLRNNSFDGNIFPHDVQFTSNMDYFNSPGPEYEFEVEVNKGIRQLKDERIQYEKQRQIIENKVPPVNKIVDEKLKSLEDKQRSNYERRMLTLNDNGLKPVKYLQHINLQEYKHIIIQQNSGWRQTRDQMTEVINEIKRAKPLKKVGFLQSFLMKIGNAEEKGTPQWTQYDKKIEEVVSTAFLFIQNWHYTEAFPVRIICIHKMLQIEEGNLYIYMRQYPKDGNNPNEPLSLQTAVSLRNRMLLAYCANKNKERVEKIGQAYVQNTKTNIGNHLVLKNLEEKFVEPPQQLKLSQAEKLANGYNRETIGNFMEKWRQRSLFEHKNSKLYLYVQPIRIQIPKTHFARNVTLETNKEYNEDFVYAAQDQNSFNFVCKKQRIYANPVQNLKNLEYQFVAKITHQSGKVDYFRNKINLSQAENEGLGFSYRLGLVPDDLSLISDTYKGDFPYVLVFQAAIKRAALIQTPENLRIFRQVNLLTKVGKIPNMYSSYYQFDYSPSIHLLVSEILRGAPTQINETNFEQTYLQFVDFFHEQENKSQNYCEYLKIKKTKTTQASGFVMRERYDKYCQYMSKNLEQVKKGYPQIFSGVANINKHAIKRQIANLTQDLKEFNSVNKSKVYHILQRYIIYQCLKNKDGAVTKRIRSSVSMGYIADKIIQIYQRNQKSNPRLTNPDINDLSIFFIAFMEVLYPESDLNTLQEDLIRIRILTKKFIPQFNYELNRRGVGLENYASSHLLQLFATLPMELCYRIWDLMIVNLAKIKDVRIICLFTLMLYQEKSGLLPIYPINQIIQSMQINLVKYHRDDAAYYNMLKIVQSYGKNTYERQTKIVELAKHKYLRKFVFGTVEANVTQDEDDFPRASELTVQAHPTSRVHTKLLSLKQLSYPLPQPGYQGSKIQNIYIFVSGIFLLNNLNLHSRNYELQINIVGGNQIAQIPIHDKSAFENKFINFDFNKDHQGVNSKPVVEFRLIEKKTFPKLLMSSRLKLNSYHKDAIYRENVILHKVSNEQYEQNNLGTSVITISLILKSINQASNELSKIEQEEKNMVQYFQKYLDFDLSPENNQGVKAMTKLDKRFRKIMDPLDQLDVEKYPGLKISTCFSAKQADWIRNSQVSIEQLKAIFSFVFSDQSQKNIRLNFPKFYESYASNFQKFDLGRFLLELILMSEMPKQKKLSMIFCIGVHYQNTPMSSDCQEMTIETFNSIIKEIGRSTGFLNACPFSNKYMGQILYGCFYEKGNKVEENKREITQILKDWAYVCGMKSQYGGMILGSVEDLSVLRALLPINILKQIECQQLCRFEVHYKINQEIYVWSATVKTSDFSVEKRGVKFLNTYPKYYQINNLMTSVAEAMYNSENIIPLQTKSTIDYQQFVEEFKKSPLLDYLLRFNERMLPSVEAGKTHYFLYQIQKFKEGENQSLSSIEHSAGPKAVDNQFYSDFAIFRSQNCMPSWRNCKVVKDEGKARAVIKFKNMPGQYLVPRFETICLDEVQLANKAVGGSDISDSQISIRNK